MIKPWRVLEKRVVLERPPWFTVGTQDVFPQGLYPLTHPVMGQHDIFLVPVAKTDAGVVYCATFN